MGVVTGSRRGVRDADGIQQFDGANLRLAPRRATVDEQRFRDLIADREHGVERRHRLLEDQRDPGAADRSHLGFLQRAQIASLEQDAAGGDPARWLDEAHDG